MFWVCLVYTDVILHSTYSRFSNGLISKIKQITTIINEWLWRHLSFTERTPPGAPHSHESISFYLWRFKKLHFQNFEDNSRGFGGLKCIRNIPKWVLKLSESLKTVQRLTKSTHFVIQSLKIQWKCSFLKHLPWRLFIKKNWCSKSSSSLSQVHGSDVIFPLGTNFESDVKELGSLSQHNLIIISFTLFRSVFHRSVVHHNPFEKSVLPCSAALEFSFPQSFL